LIGLGIFIIERGECDFIAFTSGIAMEAVQVCFDLNPDNLNREVNGLIEALASLNLEKGKIITVRQKDHYEKEGRLIEVIPCHKFLLS
jgi:predicted AAA+ superfamily ATPase